MCGAVEFNPGIIMRSEDNGLPPALPRILELFEGGRGQDNPANQGSLWAAYNAVTEWVDHERGRDVTRLEAAWYGEGRRIKQKGLEVATELAKAA